MFSCQIFQHLPSLERLSMMRYELCPDQVGGHLKNFIGGISNLENFIREKYQTLSITLSVQNQAP